jgi:hypothetical protein
VLIPTSQFLRSLVAARLAADVAGVPAVLIARTDAHSATLLTADVDEIDRAFIKADMPRTPEGFHHFDGGIKARPARISPAACAWQLPMLLLVQLNLHAPDRGCGPAEVLS